MTYSFCYIRIENRKNNQIEKYVYLYVKIVIEYIFIEQEVEGSVVMLFLERN